MLHALCRINMKLDIISQLVTKRRHREREINLNGDAFN